MSNYARFAIPGLMPPTSPHWDTVLIAPENGSLRMMVHCGRSDDQVSYALYVPGRKRGVIKDPGYDWVGYGASPCELRKISRYPELMTTSTYEPDNTLIPKIIFNGCAIPIDERPDLEDEEKVYWTLDLPQRTLPVGDTEVQVSINGKVRKYIVQRPRFDIHSFIDRTPQHEHVSKQPGENLDLAFLPNKENEVKFDLTDCGIELMILEQATFRAILYFDWEEKELEASREEEILTVNFPALKPGLGLWRVEYSLFEGDWLPLSAGDIVVTEEE